MRCELGAFVVTDTLELEVPSSPGLLPGDLQRRPNRNDLAAAPSPSEWTYTVSVRSLCEFTAKRGDLDRRFTPSATALEGLSGQTAVTSRRSSGYQTEVRLESVFEQLRVRGRADGYDPATACLEEIKTIRGHPDAVPDNRRRLHWAQLQTYGAMFCRDRGLKELSLALVYYDIDSDSETVVRQVCAAADLQSAFVARCLSFVAWARQEATHRARRDAALSKLAFPAAPFRPGQRTLAEAVYRAASSGRTLLAQAPTGIGKTLGTLYPLLRAMPVQGIDKIAYLTCKGTGRITALDALQRLRAGTEGQALRVIAIVAKAQACEHPDKACHGESCPLALGFYDKLPAARADAVAAGWLDPTALRQIALDHQLCPYYLGQELLRWSDVLVGDVHHVFDVNGQVWGLAQSQDWNLALLIDEAHNLVDRIRGLYSAGLNTEAIGAAMHSVPGALRPTCHALRSTIAAIASGQANDCAVLDVIPDVFVRELQALIAALVAHMQETPLATGPLLDLCFDLLRFQRLVECFGDHSLFEVRRTRRAAAADAQAGIGLKGNPEEDFEVTLGLRNIVPARFARPRFKAVHSTTLFSATLAPPAYQRDMLGLPQDTLWLDVPPAFAAAHLTVRVADRVSTRLPDRSRSLGVLTGLMAKQFQDHPGNYLAFFSSFDYLQQAASHLSATQPGIAQWQQSRGMDESARQAFLDRFSPSGAGIGFAVLGGVFAEGVDLPGKRLVGAFIATLGLPPVSPAQDQMKARLDTVFGEGHGYADLVPSMHKVVQAAGRVLRTPEDRGWLWLVDDRYGRPEVAKLLPAWWGLGGARSPTTLGAVVPPPQRSRPDHTVGFEPGTWRSE